MSDALYQDQEPVSNVSDQEINKGLSSDLFAQLEADPRFADFVDRRAQSHSDKRAASIENKIGEIKSSSVQYNQQLEQILDIYGKYREAGLDPVAAKREVRVELMLMESDSKNKVKKEDDSDNNYSQVLVDTKAKKDSGSVDVWDTLLQYFDLQRTPEVVAIINGKQPTPEVMAQLIAIKETNKSDGKQFPSADLRSSIPQSGKVKSDEELFEEYSKIESSMKPADIKRRAEINAEFDRRHPEDR